MMGRSPRMAVLYKGKPIYLVMWAHDAEVDAPSCMVMIGMTVNLSRAQSWANEIGGFYTRVHLGKPMEIEE